MYWTKPQACPQGYYRVKQYPAQQYAGRKIGGTVTLERELDIVKDYLALEQMRFEERLKIEFDIDEDTLQQQVPPMMLQTLVENAIKHGISKQVLGGVVRIVAVFKDNVMQLDFVHSPNEPENSSIAVLSPRLAIGHWPSRSMAFFCAAFEGFLRIRRDPRPLAPRRHFPQGQAAFCMSPQV